MRKNRDPAGTVLIVDDEVTVRELLSFQVGLILPACHLETTASAEEALEVLGRLRVDVLITDLEMPGMSGMELIAKAGEQFPGLRMVIVTGYPSRDNWLEALGLGVWDYLQKPFSLEDLRDTVASALTGHAAEARMLTRHLDQWLQEVARLLRCAGFPPVELALSMNRSGADHSQEPISFTFGLSSALSSYESPRAVATWERLGLFPERADSARFLVSPSRLPKFRPPAEWPYSKAYAHILFLGDGDTATILTFPHSPTFRLSPKRAELLASSSGFVRSAALDRVSFLGKLYRARPDTENRPGLPPRKIASREDSPSAERFELAELGKMIAGLTHDLRNGLGLIRTYGELALQSPEEEADRETLERIGQALRYSELLLGNLSDLVYRSRPVQRQHDLDSLIRDTLSVLEPRIPENVRVDLELRAGATVLGDEGQLQRVLMNLIQNATQAMPEGGALSIHTHVTEGESSPGVELTIRDTGLGMNAQELEKIFELSYTTKREGYGLGLFIVQRLIEAHNGRIEVESEPGLGTSFRVTFPTLASSRSELKP